MKEYTITLAGVYTVTAQGQSVDVDMYKLPQEIIAKAVLHGLTKKIADSAASAHADAVCAKFGWDAQAYKAGKDTQAVRDYVNSPAYASDKSAIALANMQSTVEVNLYSGAWAAERQRATGASKVDPVRKLARDMATTFLTQSLTARIGKDMAKWAKEPKLAALFTFTEKGNARFDLQAVDKWMQGFAARDFMAEAKVQIESAQSAGAGLDLADLGL